MKNVSLHVPASLRRGIRHGWLSLRRERGWKTTFALLVALAVLLQGSFLLTAVVQGADQLLRSQLDLRLEVKDGVPVQRVQEFIEAVKTQPSVAQVVYITREQAYQTERERDPSLISFLEQFNIQNPFPDTVSVTLKSLDDYAVFASFVRQEQWSAIVDPGFLSSITDQESEVLSLLELTRAGRAVMGALVLVLAIIILGIIIEIVRRRALYRHEEIFVEQLTGASAWWVMTPFITETSLLLWAAVVVSVGVAAGGVFLLPVYVPALATLGEYAVLSRETMHVVWQYVPWVLAAEVLLVPLVALIGTMLALRLHLRDQVVNVLRRLRRRKA